MLIADIPETLQHHFEHTAHLLYQTDGVKQALMEAMELWLAQHRNPVIEAEARANNQAYQNLKEELEQKYLGKWIVIAHGQLQGVGDSIMELNHLASDAHDRIVVQVGQQYPQKVELGWQFRLKPPVQAFPAGLEALAGRSSTTLAPKIAEQTL